MELSNYLTITEAAAELSRSVPTVYKYITEGRLKKHTALGRTLLRRREVLNLRKAMEAATDGEVS